MAYAYMKTQTKDPKRAPYKVCWQLPGEKRAQSRSFWKKADATTELRIRTAEVAGITPPARPERVDDEEEVERVDVTLAEYAVAAAETWTDLEPNTRSTYRALLRYVQSRTIGTMRLDEVRPTDVQNWIRELETRYAAGTVQKAVNVLRRVYADAVRDELVSTNPVLYPKPRRGRVEDVPGLRLPKVRAKEARFLLPEELRALREALPVEYRPMVDIAKTAGPRIGELLAIRWRDVNLLRGTVTIARTTASDDGRLYINDSTKTYAGRRTTPLLPEAVASLRALHDERSPRADDPVFPSPAGGYWHAANFRRRVWHPAVKRAGLPGRVPPHVLRHTAVAAMLSSSMNPKLAAQLVGHARGGFSEGRYGHVIPAATQAAVEHLSAFYAETDTDDVADVVELREAQ